MGWMKDLSRRDFLSSVGAGTLSLAIAGCDTGERIDPLSPVAAPFKPTAKVTLKINGASKPFQFIHLTDVHLCECDARNPELIEFMARRKNDFRKPEQTARNLFNHLNTLESDFMVITGDLVDVPTRANLEKAKKLLDSIDAFWWFTMGNHEWGGRAIPRDREFWSSEYRLWTYQPLNWYYKQLHGINLLFLDNSNYQITRDQLTRTRVLLDTGRPCIMFAHIPILIDTLVKPVNDRWGMPICIGGEPVDMERRLSWDMGPTIEPATREFLALVRSHPGMKAIFSGHLHFNHTDEYQPGYPQYVTGAAYENVYRRVTIEPA